MPFEKGHAPARRGGGLGLAFLKANSGHVGTDCLVWPMSLDGRGYGHFGLNGRLHKAHRYMCELAHGPAPTPNHHAAHSCGRCDCVNPNHIRWATPRQNMADSVRLGAVNQKGRPRYKLTEEDVARIYKMRGTMPYDKIGAMFGVKGKQIGKILRGEQWKGGRYNPTGIPLDRLPPSS